MAGLFFSEGLLQKLILHGKLSKHFLEPAVLFLNGFGLGHHRGIHPAIFGAPFVKCRIGYGVLPAQLNNPHPSLCLLQHRHDL